MKQEEKSLFPIAAKPSGPIFVHTEEAIMNAAREGLFLQASQGNASGLLPPFIKREYTIRYAEKQDLAQLEALEQRCWAPTLQASKEILLKRMEQYPQGQLVLEKGHQVIGVIYSQRLADQEDLYNACADTVLDLHRPNGPVIQLLAVNILPEWQDCKFGDQLLEFMLQRCSLLPDARAVVAVTLCRNYKNYLDMSVKDYIRLRNEAGKLTDPVLRFHELHGATIERAIENYRPFDTDSSGYGVLVSYDIHRRQRDDIQLLVSIEDPAAPPPVPEEFLEKAVKQVLGKSRETAFAADRPLMDMGLDSADLLALMERVGTTYRIQLDGTFFFQCNTVERIASFLTRGAAPNRSASGKSDLASEKTTFDADPTTTSIAIIGIGCRLPGGMKTAADFWDFLCRKKSAISTVPNMRWTWPAEIHPDDDHPGIDKGGFLTDFDCFDPQFFRISPKEAEIMDPQQRILMELAWDTLEDAGYPASRVSGSDIGVFIGASGSDYALLLQSHAESIEPHLGTGTSMAVLPNRISYFYNFHGPSILIDTACSSSLVAVHEAIHSLRRGDCKQALVGGINVICHPANTIAYYKAGMLSKDGRCKTFDQEADGYVRAEGALMVFLKPLRQAAADGDRIYAVVRGTATNHGGQASGLTVPNPEKQAALLVKAYRDAGISPRTVQYIEAHGTGTSLGDPIEVKGLEEAFNQLLESDERPSWPWWCGLGSVKTNIGHLEAAAGLAGLVKAALSLYHGKLPATLNFKQFNPHIDLSRSPFYILSENRPWDSEGPRRAGVSSFGSGGANAHAILEEYPNQTKTDLADEGPWVFVFSAKDKERLHAYAEQLLKSVQKEGAPSLREITYTLQTSREVMEERVALLITSREELVEKLGRFCAKQSDIEYLYHGSPKALPPATKILTAGMMAEAATDQAIREKDLKKLAMLWSLGVSIEWTRLYNSRSIERVSLPGYPFARQRYWISSQAALPNELATSHILHPLVHRNTSNLQCQRFTSSFHGREFFLEDHQIFGEKLLPGVAYLEMVREACQLSNAGEVNGFRNIVWASPLAIHGASQQVEINLYPDHNGVRYEVYSADPLTPDGRRTYSQGIVLTVPDLTRSRRKLDTETILARCRNSSSQEQFYSDLTRIGLKYGDTFRSVTSMQWGQNEAVSRFELPPAANSSARSFLWHPGILDSALQAASWMMQLSQADSNGPYLPYAVSSIEVYQRLPERGFVYVRHSADPQSNNLKSYDIDLATDGGDICFSLNGLSLRRSEQDKGILYATFEWQEKALTRDLAEPSPEIWVIAGDIGKAQMHMLDVRFGPRVKQLQKCQAANDPSCALEIFQQAFGFLQAIMLQRPVTRHRILAYVSQEPEPYLYASLAGLFKTANRENPLIEGKLIFVQHNAMIEDLYEESVGAWDGIEVRHTRSGKREVRRPVEIHAEQSEACSPIKPGGVYWITGGAGGLGVIFARHLGQTPQVKVILSGRSELAGEKRAVLNELSQAAIQADYLRADVSRREDVEEVVRTIWSRYGRLDGIVHAAGVLDDAFILNKKPEQTEKVFSPKVKGLIHIDQATQHISLDFLVVFSSLSAVLGNVGQADYSGANAFMDAFAEYRNSLVKGGKRSGTTVSINWPLWREGGMTMEEAAKDTLWQIFGVSELATKRGLAAFEAALKANTNQLLVIEGQAAKMRERILGHSSRRQRVQTDLRMVDTKFDLGSKQGPGKEAGPQLAEKAVDHLKRLLSSTLKLTHDRIDEYAPLKEYGIDSMLVLQMTNVLEQAFGPLSKTLFFEYQTLAELARYFMENHRTKLAELLANSGEPKNDRAAAIETPPNAAMVLESRFRSVEATSIRRDFGNERSVREIAIIGLSGQYPQAPNLEVFWENLRSGKDCITEIPMERWDHRLYYDPDKTKSGKSYSRWGGFIDDVDKFDPLFFGIFPREAEIMEPQERLFLQCAWAALEDAGYMPESFQKEGGWSKVGVYVGVMFEEYQLYGVEETLRGNTTALNGLPAGIANRVSHVCNFHGPSMAVDTMCSSSLTALHLACQSLRNGECDMALAGGVNVSIHPNKYIYLSQGRFVSSRGRCESFGEGAEGYVPGEGVGAVLLKPKDRAIADGDHIYGVIRATAVNHGGRTNGYTVPNPNSQANVIGDALESAGIPPRAISYLEAHGTGTSLGDPIEITGLTKAFRVYTDEKQYCPIGSVKSNIGHCESAAGIAGLTKVLLQLKYCQLAPSLHSEVLNPNINFAETPFFVQQTLQEWKRPVLESNGGMREYPRIAGISSFGAGGSNAHVVIEEYIPDQGEHSILSGAPSKNSAIVPLSARSEEQLKAYARNLWNFLQGSEPDLLDLAYTFQVGRKPLDYRVAFVVNDLAVLKSKLGQFLSGQPDIDSCYQGHAKSLKETGSLFASDEDLKEAVGKWVVKGKLERLAQLWVRGLSLDWEALHPGSKRNRISLPTYPFLRERYWIPESKNADSKGMAVSDPIGDPLNPFITHLNLASEHQEFMVHLKGDENFVSVHAEKQVKSLLGLTFLDMGKACGELTLRQELLGLKNVVWGKPVQMNGHSQALKAVVFRDGLDFAYKIFTENGSHVIHQYGEFILNGPRTQRAIDVRAIQSRLIASDNAATLASFIREKDAKLGSFASFIQSLQHSDREMLSRVLLADQARNKISRSILLNVCWQCLAFWEACLGIQRHSLLFPLAVEEVYFSKSLPQEIFIYFALKTGDATLRKYDVVFCSPVGESFMHCRDLAGLELAQLNQISL